MPTRATNSYASLVEFRPIKTRLFGEWPMYLLTDDGLVERIVRDQRDAESGREPDLTTDELATVLRFLVRNDCNTVVLNKYVAV